MHSRKRLNEIQFPVYMLRKYNSMEKSSNLVRILTHHDEYVLDSLLLAEQEPDYATRRIILKANGYNVYPLKVRYDSISKLIHAKSGTTFIDSAGYLFRYKRGNKYYSVESFKIKKLAYSAKHGSIITAYDLPFPLFYPDRLKSFYRYVNCIKYKGGYMLYSVTKEKLPPKRVRL